MAAVSHSTAAVAMPTVVAAFCGDQTHWVTPDEWTGAHAHAQTHTQTLMDEHVCTNTHTTRAPLKGKGNKEKHAGELYTGG